jgi:hypothetical protein
MTDDFLHEYLLFASRKVVEVTYRAHLRLETRVEVASRSADRHIDADPFMPFEILLVDGLVLNVSVLNMSRMLSASPRRHDRVILFLLVGEEGSSRGVDEGQPRG